MNLENVRIEKVSAIVVGMVFDIQQVRLDKLRAESGFQFITAVGAQILLGNPNAACVQMSIQPNRMEFVSTNGKDFETGTFFESIKRVVGCISNVEFKVTAVGTNYLLNFSVPGVSSAASYMRDNFLKDATRIGSLMGEDVLSSATRIILGEPAKYRDIKLHPKELVGPEFETLFHVHRQEDGLSVVGLPDHLEARFKTELEQFVSDLRKL